LRQQGTQTCIKRKENTSRRDREAYLFTLSARGRR